MIKTKEELREYLRRDNGGWGQKPFLYRLIKRIGGSENYRIKEFFRILRHYEFYLNGGGEFFQFIGSGDIIIIATKLKCM